MIKCVLLLATRLELTDEANMVTRRVRNNARQKQATQAKDVEGDD